MNDTKYQTEKLYKTSNYDLFSYVHWNRTVKTNRPQSKKLYKSMREYGFLPSHPIMVRTGSNGRLIVFDGQHRLYFARQLGLPVFFVIDESGIDIPSHQETNRKWDVQEHVERWQREGKKDYAEVLDFAKRFNITVGQSAGILAGTTKSSNVMLSIKEGYYSIKTRDIAYSVGECFREIKSVSKVTNNNGVIDALFACHFVDYFDVDHFLDKVDKNPQMIVNCDGRNGFLDLFQEIYNHRTRSKVPLAFDAKMAIEKRNAVQKK
jgi:hypothetical protein